MNPIIPFFRITRILNVLILILVQAILYFAYFQYYADQSGVPLVLSKANILIYLGITAFLMIAGNIINDIQDIDIDIINRPEKRVVDKTISKKAAWAMYHASNIAALVLAVYWCWSTGLYTITAILILSGVGMYFYSSWMKRKFIIGNLFVAILCALPPVLILFIESPTLSAIADQNSALGIWIVSIIGIYSYFAFSTTLYREIVKDIQDIPGDKAVGCTTLPVLVGGFMAKRVALVAAFMIGFTLLAWLIYQWPMGYYWNSAAIILGLTLPLGISILRLQRARSVTDFKSVSNAIKLLMLNGIIYLLIVKMIIPNI